MKRRALLIALAGFTLVPAANSSAAPLSYGTYYDETVSAPTCVSTSVCSVYFSVTPADKLLMIKKINCTFNTPSAVQVAVLEIATTSHGSALQRVFPLPMPPAQNASGNYYTSLESQPDWLVGQSRFPFILFSTITSSNFMNGTCTLRGELVDPIP